jgi:phage gp37-like protein
MTITEESDEIMRLVREQLPDIHVAEHAGVLDSADLAQITARMPWVLVEYDHPDAEKRSPGGGVALWRRTYNIFVGARNLRSQVEGKRSAYDLLDGVRVALDGHARWEDEQLVINVPGAIVYQTVWSTLSPATT